MNDVPASTSPPRILIAEDDLSLGELLADYLQREQFAVTVVVRGDDVIAAIAAVKPDLLILDVMLPGLGGFDVLRQLREKSATLPVLMLTARGDDVDRIVGLELGADDYLPKPFNPRELVARLRSILRRAKPVPLAESDTLRNGPLHLNRSTREARLGEHAMPLTTAEFELLAALIAQCGQVVSKEDLARLALQRTLNPFDRAIDVHLSHLRKKIEAAGGDAHWLLSVRGQGYQLARLA